MSEQKDSIPLSGSPDKERKQQNPLPPGETPQRPDLLATIYKPHVRGDKFSWWDIVHSKRAWTVFVILLFLSYFFTAIPVEKVPVLRNLAYLMGYTREETKTFSFLKTLLTLPQRYKARRAEKEDWENIRKSSAAAIAASTEEALLYKAQLINFKQSSKGTNPRGQDSDQLQKVRQANSARDSRVVAMASVQREDPAAAQTAQKATGNEVFFGTQEGTIPRDPTVGFDTTQKLAALPSPGIVDSNKTDKLLEAAESFYSRTTNIDFQNKLVDHTVGSRTMLQDVESPDDKKPKVDVVYAWLTSRAAKRTENKMLKKTLAAASFIGADLTRPMLLTSLDGTGTVAVDPRQIDIDISVAKDRVEREERCTDYLTEGSYQTEIGSKWELINGKGDNPGLIFELWNAAHNLYGATCSDYQSLLDTFDNKRKELNTNCSTLNDKYNNVENICEIKIKKGSCNSELDSLNEGNLEETIKSWCKAQLDLCPSTCSKEQQCSVFGTSYTSSTACKKAVNDAKLSEQGSSEIRDPLSAGYLSEKETFEDVLKGGFFPGVDKNNIQEALSGRIGLDWATSSN